MQHNTSTIEDKKLYVNEIKDISQMIVDNYKQYRHGLIYAYLEPLLSDVLKNLSEEKIYQLFEIGDYIDKKFFHSTPTGVAVAISECLFNIVEENEEEIDFTKYMYDELKDKIVDWYEESELK